MTRDAVTPRRSLPMRAYLGLLVAVVLLAAGASAAYVRDQAERDANAAAGADARFAAVHAASAIGADIASVQSQVQAAAATPGIAAALASPAGCTLSFSGLAVFPTGHLDLIGSGGADACSSLQKATAAGNLYGGAAWLPAALAAPMVTGPVPDPATGSPVVAVTAPVGGRGFVGGFLDVSAMGPALAEAFGGPRQLEFVVTTGDGARAVTRSLDPARWAGTALASTPFRRPGPGLRTGVDGHRRLYASSPVEVVGWTVDAGADEAQATAAAMGLFHRNLAIVLAGLLVSLGAALFVYRRLGRPIHLLRATIQGSRAGELSLRGPAEIVGLAGDYQHLAASIEHELSERLRAQDAAEASERRYRLLFQDNPLPMWVYDSQSLAFLEVNDAAVAAYGYSRDEFLAMTIKDIRPPADVPAVLDSVKAAPVLDHSGPWRHVKKGGGVIQVEIYSHGIAFDNHLARFVVVEDVTQRERLEGELRQAQRLESLGQLAGGIAHDFNNLLGVILNYAAFVDQDLQASGSREATGGIRADVVEIKKAAERAASLTRQLLTFARREVTRPDVVDLNDAVHSMQALLGRTLGEHVVVHVSLDPAGCRVVADPTQVEQVLVNLAVNARDAMPGGGTLSIETSRIVADQSYADARPGLRPGTYARIRVSDTGEGIPPEHLERVFDPFFTTKPPGQGTGLGLATVHGIVTRAGGVVHIYSEVGLGTTVSILLPATEESQAGPGVVVASGSPGAGRTVLLVEDETALRAVTQRILEQNGYAVLSAAGAEEALEQAASHAGSVDLILTDVIMPKVLGRELAASLRGSQPGARVLFMSGYAHPFLASTGTLEEGVVLIEKPFSEAVLLAKIDQVLAT